GRIHQKRPHRLTGRAREKKPALTGCVVDIPRGCMVALSSVGSEGHVELGELVRAARAVTLDRLKARLNQAISKGEIPVSTAVHALS
ncbi:hypothetical protein AB9F45_37030, partial [Rhizobium leguminosarum]